MTTFTPHQNQALSAVADWLKAKPGKNGTPQVFRLFGYAGTGKTTLARHIADGVERQCEIRGLHRQGRAGDAQQGLR
jgi:exodeoxyribonuclease-5